jgi:hypothetical protein
MLTPRVSTGGVVRMCCCPFLELWFNRLVQIYILQDACARVRVQMYNFQYACACVRYHSHGDYAIMPLLTPRGFQGQPCRSTSLSTSRTRRPTCMGPALFQVRHAIPAGFRLCKSFPPLEEKGFTLLISPTNPWGSALTQCKMVPDPLYFIDCT